VIAAERSPAVDAVRAPHTATERWAVFGKTLLLP
jgi:hypothetical protein